MLLLGNLAMSQQCVYVDSVYNTAKLRELGNRDIRFGIKQIVEEELSEKFCLSDDGKDMDVEVFYFGLPKTTNVCFISCCVSAIPTSSEVLRCIHASRCGCDGSPRN